MGLFGKIMAVGVVASAKKVVDKISNRKSSNEYIKVDDFIYDLLDLNYKDAKEALEGYGFTNVSFIAKRDLKRELKQGIFFKEKNKYKDGEVEEISINGETDFEKCNKFLPTARVAIVYHTYPDAEVKKVEEKCYAKCPSCKASVEYIKSKPICPYCGEVINK